MVLGTRQMSPCLSGAYFLMRYTMNKNITNNAFSGRLEDKKCRGKPGQVQVIGSMGWAGEWLCQLQGVGCMK